VNSQQTTYCYNTADQLIGSSNPALDAPTYDTHGNTTSFGTGANTTSFTYDSSDRNTSITQGTVNTSYVRDALGDIIARTTTDGSGNTVTTNYGPGIVLDTSFNVIEQDVGLPGGVSLTIRPQDSSAGYLSASMTNLQGDVIATTDADGALTGTYSYDPFGNLMSSAGELTNVFQTSIKFASKNHQIGPAYVSRTEACFPGPSYSVKSRSQSSY
jgi:YD repeat-containing protein